MSEIIDRRRFMAALAAAGPALWASHALAAPGAASGFSRVTNGRFTGGWTTRHYGRPADGVHAIQMELSCRSYLRESNEDSWASGPPRYDRDTWPPPYDDVRAAPIREALQHVLEGCLKFANTP